MAPLSRERLSLGMLTLIVLTFVATACSGEEPSPKPAANTQKDGAKLPDQFFAAHFVDSYPNHGELFAQVPDRAQIDFNFTLSEVSSISVIKDGKPIETGKLTLGPRNLTMLATLPGMAGNGSYLVKYKACWPDRSCHDGQFAFTVDGATTATYLDMTGKSEVQVDLKALKFQPSNIILSKGTRVTWTNRDSVPHFANTDPHPSHNVLAGLNSLTLNEGQTYSFTFTEPGEWGYHCSAHFPQGMVARVIIR